MSCFPFCTRPHAAHRLLFLRISGVYGDQEGWRYERPDRPASPLLGGPRWNRAASPWAGPAGELGWLGGIDRDQRLVSLRSLQLHGVVFAQRPNRTGKHVRCLQVDAVTENRGEGDAGTLIKTPKSLPAKSTSATWGVRITNGGISVTMPDGLRDVRATWRPLRPRSTWRSDSKPLTCPTAGCRRCNGQPRTWPAPQGSRLRPLCTLSPANRRPR